MIIRALIYFDVRQEMIFLSSLHLAIVGFNQRKTKKLKIIIQSVRLRISVKKISWASNRSSMANRNMYFLYQNSYHPTKMQINKAIPISKKKKKKPDQQTTLFRQQLDLSSIATACGKHS